MMVMLAAMSLYVQSQSFAVWGVFRGQQSWCDLCNMLHTT